MEIDRIQRKSHLRLPWANNACWSCPPTDSDSGMCLQHKGLKDLYQFQPHQVLFLIWEIAPRLTKALSIINSQPKSTHSYVMSLDLMVRFKNNSVFTLLYQVENWSHRQRLKFAFNHSFPSSTWNQGLPVLVNTSQTGLTSLSIFLHTPVFSSYCYAHSQYFVFYLIYSYHANMCCSGCINSSAHSHNPPL